MTIKTLRKEKLLSQEQLAEKSGLSLRTVQRMESGKSVSLASLKTMAYFFNTNTSNLQTEKIPPTNPSHVSQHEHLATHRSFQLVILFVTYFVCVTSWLAYYYEYINPISIDNSLSTTLTYILQMSAVFSVFAYLFYTANTIFVLSYYTTTSIFVLTAVALNYWTQDFTESPTYPLFFPVFFTLMLLCLSTIQVLQLAVSLKGESSAGSLRT